MLPGEPTRKTPTFPQVERRRRARGAVSRLLTRSVPTARVESGLGRLGARVARAWPLVPLALVIGLLWLIWAGRAPVLTPRHRPEALWFALAQTRFAPPMTVEPSAAMVRGRFNHNTPAQVAVREAMHFTEDMVMRERLLRVGDFDVAVLWLRIPGSPGHWLVMAWMEGADLALASFRFDGAEMDITPDELLWANRLMRSVLVEEHFRADALPAIRLQVKGGTPPATFGPKTPG
jgi:hypothetical protein